MKPGDTLLCLQDPTLHVTDETKVPC